MQCPALWSYLHPLQQFGQWLCQNIMALSAGATGAGVGSWYACCFPSPWQPASSVAREMWKQTLDLNVSVWTSQPILVVSYISHTPHELAHCFTARRVSLQLSNCLLSTFAVDLIPDNLPKLMNLLVDASPEWLELGLQLGVNQTTLRIIRQDNHHSTKRKCYLNG